MFYSCPARKVCSYRPRLEILEDRTLPSTFLVDHLADDTVGSGLTGSLRYAITNAADNDHITFGVTGTINLSGGLPDLAHSISIEGPGANLLTVRRNTGGNYRIFTVYDGTVSISGLTITNGYVFGDYYASGGGILNYGILTVNNSTISGNTAYYENWERNGGLGGGICNDGILTLSNTTVAGNVAGGYYTYTGQGGGIYNEDGTLTLNNATVSGNTAVRGGGIANTTGATVTLNNSTVSGNVALEAGGIDTGSALSLSNSIVGGNGASNISGSFTDLGHNLIGGNPLLGPLQDNGGPTQTMALLPGSPAIDAGDPNFTGPPDWDQRGEGYARISGSAVDIGAFEVQEPPAFRADFPSPATAGDNDPFTVTALDANGNPDPTYTGTVHFRSADPRAVLPDDYTFTAADQGVHTFNASFLTAGTWTLIVNDTATPALAGLQTGIVILPAAADHFTVSGTAGVVVDNSPFTLTVTAFDAYGNRAPTYQGTVHFSSTDAQATLPADYTFTAADAGSHPLTITLHTAGQQTVTVQDTVNGALVLDQDVRVTRTVWLATSFDNSSVLRYDSETGAFIDTFIRPGAGGLDGPINAVIGPDGNLYVTSRNNNRVLRYDRNTGAYLGDFVTAGSGGLTSPQDLVFQGNYLYVSSPFTTGRCVFRYDAVTGAFVDRFVAATSGGLQSPTGLLFGADGDLYVNSAENDGVMRYDGTSGVPLPAPGQTGAVFVAAHSGGLLNNYGKPAFGPDGNLYVGSWGTNNVLRYDGATGAFLGTFVPAGSGGLNKPEGLAFGPDGDLYVLSQGTNNILRYDGTTGTFLGVFSGPGGALLQANYLTYWDLDAPAPAPRPGRSHAHGVQSTPLAVLIGDFAPSFESASWNPWPVAALPSGMSGVSSRAAPLAALVGDGEFTPITSAQQTLTADDAAGGFSACAMLTVQDGRQPAPGRHRRVDSVDAFFAVVAAGWSGHGHQSGAPALWGDWTTAS